MAEKYDRPSWDEKHMAAAFNLAKKSSCVYLHNGVVIIKDKRGIAEGYNGAGPGLENCLTIGCRKEREGSDFEEKDNATCRGTHAEKNAMDQISRENLKGTSLYTVFFPCSSCAKSIVSNGVAEVVYSEIYTEPDSLTMEQFQEAGIKLRRLEFDVEKDYRRLKAVKNQKYIKN